MDPNLYELTEYHHLVDLLLVAKNQSRHYHLNGQIDVVMNIKIEVRVQERRLTKTTS